jgi:hypothetical protein
LLIEGPIVQARTLHAQLAEWLPSVAAADPSATPDLVRMEQTWLAARLFLAEKLEDAAIVWLAADSPTDAAAEVSTTVERLLARNPTPQPEIE